MLVDHPPIKLGSGADEAALLAKLARGETLSLLEQVSLSTIRRLTGVLKADVSVEIIRHELEGYERVVVFAYHREVIHLLEDGLGSDLAASITGDTPAAKRQALIDGFQTERGPRVLILQVTAAGVAITLTAARRVLFVESSWVPADFNQAVARCHRIGQRHPVLASIITMAGSIDERVADVVARKVKDLDRMQSLLRAGAA